jgi:branched-chain amino acid aminotransferase
MVDMEKETTYTFGDGITPGPVISKLYHNLLGIQNGDMEDSFGWTKILD